ncbi:MAG: dihydropteroate synthase [Candidatus Omnitrophota bacterium]
MVIIGERINSTRKDIQKAIRSKNSSVIVDEAKRQVDHGASVLDVNCAMGLENEHQDLDWTISILNDRFPGIGICIDSPNYRAIEAALKVYKGGGAIFINSITGEDARIDAITPLAVKYNAKVIALTMDERGMPEGVEERAAIAEKILKKTNRHGLKDEALYFDPLVRPLSTEPEQAKALLAAIPAIKKIGGVKTICGLSNISFGLPKRSVINAAFLAMAIYAGLDAGIVDPTDRGIYATIKSATALIGEDEYCAGYIGSFREGKL